MNGLKLLFVLVLSLSILIPIYAKEHKGSHSKKGSAASMESKGSAARKGSGNHAEDKGSHGMEEHKGSKGKKDKTIVDTGWERKADTDGDGCISEEEYVAYRETLGENAAVLEPMENYFGKDKESKGSKMKKENAEKKGSHHMSDN